MIVFFYEKVRLKRGVWQTVSIVLLIAFLCAFFTLFDGFICQKEQDMESAYAVIPVTVVVSNLTGTKTDDLKITDYIINYFLSDKYAYGGAHTRPGAWFMWQRLILAHAPPRGPC